MAPKDAAEGGGQGICLYLLDPSVPGWDRDFDGSGPLGFVGEPLPLSIAVPAANALNDTAVSSVRLHHPHLIDRT